MDKNQIKKEIYKQNPFADFHCIRDSYLYYVSSVEVDSETKLRKIMRFDIPLSEVSGAKFFPKMEAKLLIRWMELDLEL